MSLIKEKLKAQIRIKKMLKSVSVAEVAKKMNCSRQNIYWHLSEKRADNVSLLHLENIVTAINDVAKAEELKQTEFLSKLNN